MDYNRLARLLASGMQTVRPVAGGQGYGGPEPSAGTMAPGPDPSRPIHNRAGVQVPAIGMNNSPESLSRWESMKPGDQYYDVRTGWIEPYDPQPPQQMPPVTAQASPLPPTPMMRAAAPPNPGYIMPPQEQYGPPEPYGPQAPPMPRNDLERDYYRQLAQNPGGFDKGWLGRVFG